jgi:hypothetical protein
VEGAEYTTNMRKQQETLWKAAPKKLGGGTASMARAFFKDIPRGVVVRLNGSVFCSGLVCAAAESLNLYM